MEEFISQSRKVERTDAKQRKESKRKEHWPHRKNIFWYYAFHMKENLNYMLKFRPLEPVLDFFFFFVN